MPSRRDPVASPIRASAPAPDGQATSARGAGCWLRTLRAYFLLPHPLPVLVVLAATTGFAVLVAGGLPPAGELIRLLLAMLGGQLAIGAVNEVVDADLDAVAKPWKPIPAGEISVRAALVAAAVGLVTMVGFGAGFGPVALALLALGTGSGLAYDLWFKRGPLSWLPYLVALPLLPLWVRTALVGFDARMLLLYPLGGAAIVGVHLAQTVPDVGGDRATGLRNLASILGERRALVACWAATLSAPALAVATAPALGADPSVVRLAALVAVALVALDALLYAVRPRLGVRACFPCVAIATVIVGLGWVLGVSR